MTAPRRTPFRSSIWPQLRLAILERDHWRCQIRGPGCTRTATQVDHIVSWRDGGSWFGEHNLRAACTHCNASRGGQRKHGTLPPQAATAPPSRPW